MHIKNRLKRWFKFRFVILYLLGVTAVLFAIPDDNSIRQGIGLIIAGLLIRIWANGYAIKLTKLTISGPYAFVRHPLYLGTMLLVIGFNIVLRINYAAAFFVIILISGIYYKTIAKEEKMLIEKFGEVYIDYKKRVPAIVPAFFPYRHGEKWPFSFRRFIKSQEYKLFLWLIVLIIVFHLKHEFMVEREALDAQHIRLIIAAFILGMLDLLGEFIRHKRKLNKNKPV